MSRKKNIFQFPIHVISLKLLMMRQPDPDKTDSLLFVYIQVAVILTSLVAPITACWRLAISINIYLWAGEIICVW